MEQLLCLDHISLHLRDSNIEYMDKNEQIKQLQKQANKSTGFPFEPWNVCSCQKCWHSFPYFFVG